MKLYEELRKALEMRNKDRMGTPSDFLHFKKAYEILGDKLCPKVYELWFLR